MIFLVVSLHFLDFFYCRNVDQMLPNKLSSNNSCHGQRGVINKVILSHGKSHNVLPSNITGIVRTVLIIFIHFFRSGLFSAIIVNFDIVALLSIVIFNIDVLWRIFILIGVLDWSCRIFIMGFFVDLKYFRINTPTLPECRLDLPSRKTRF